MPYVVIEGDLSSSCTRVYGLNEDDVKEFQDAINCMDKEHRPSITQYHARLTISRNASLVLNSFDYLGYRVITTVMKKENDANEIVWTMYRELVKEE